MVENINNEYWTEKECCKQAIEVQNACNIGGVSRDYHKLIISIRKIYGWNYKLIDNPAVILWHDKLEDLLGISLMDRNSEKYGEAYSECRRIINSKED
jgi:hypothetical protein